MSSPADCPLHAALLKPNSLCYSPRTDGAYSMYAPSCTGCTIGVAEQLVFRRRNLLGFTLHAVAESNTATNVQAALRAISDSLINADDADANDARFRLKQLLLIKDLAFPADNDSALPPLTGRLVDAALEMQTDDSRLYARAFIGGVVLHGSLGCLQEASAHLDRLFNR